MLKTCIHNFTRIRSYHELVPFRYVLFTEIPFTSGDKWAMEQLLPAIGERNQVVILTTEPRKGLEAVTDNVISDLIVTLKKYEDIGVSFIVRFGHEMNGSWYPWSQQPGMFVSKFRRISRALREGTEYATMIFCPTLGTGYPFVGGKYIARCGTMYDSHHKSPRSLLQGKQSSSKSDCKLLDTNDDGVFTEADDMFSPYWPGDHYVDWVGSSIYWWGKQYPWGENELPDPRYFYNVLTGNTQKCSGTKVPDFYQTYSQNKNIAMVITETAALYNLCDIDPNTKSCKTNRAKNLITGAVEHDIKSRWVEQVFSLQGPTSTRKAFPNIKIISWFNVKKQESEVGGNSVDWTTYSSDELKESFIKTLRHSINNDRWPYWITGWQ